MDSQATREDPAVVAVDDKTQLVVPQQAVKDLLEARLSQKTLWGKRLVAVAVVLEALDRPETH
jgi:hypothetical protein